MKQEVGSTIQRGSVSMASELLLYFRPQTKVFST